MVCIDCGEPTGRAAQAKRCLVCVDTYRKDYANAYANAYYQVPEYKAAKNAYRQTPAGKALDKARKQTAEYKASQNAYRQTPKYKAANREHGHRRRVLQRNGFVERVYLAVLVERDKGRCGVCSKPVPVKQRSIDHILPVSKGGAHSYANTRLTHLRCNVLRNNRGAAQLRLA